MSGTVNDPDDISAMSYYLLFFIMFNTKDIIVTSSTHRKEHTNTPNQGDWANNFFGNVYASYIFDLKRILANI